MRVVFMGTPEFAVPSLSALHRAHDVVAVVTRPDAIAGRGGARRPSPVKCFAEEHAIDVLQPAAMDAAVNAAIARLAPDVVCVAAFGMLLPPETLSLAPSGCVNVHASVLPRHRGAAPIARAILAGDSETGISIMRMEQGLDTGPVALVRRTRIGEKYASELERELSTLGSEALLETLRQIEDGTVQWVAQDERHATYASKVTKDDVALRPELSLVDAYRRVRASTHRAPARACLGDREVTIVRAHPTSEIVGPGAVCVRDGWPLLGCADGALVLDVVRPAGRADMPGSEWSRGARLTDDVCWRCTR